MKTLRRWLKRCAWTLGILAVALWITWLLLPKPELLPPGAEFSHVVLDRDGRVLFLSLTRDGKYRLPVKLDDISPELLNATLEMEDRRFFSHHGADPRSLLRAAWGAVTGQRLGDLFGDLLHQRRDDGLFIGEIPAERSGRHVGAGGDLVDGGALVALLGAQPRGDVDQRGAGSLLFPFPQPESRLAGGLRHVTIVGAGHSAEPGRVLKLCYRGTGHTTSIEVTKSPVHSFSSRR